MRTPAGAQRHHADIARGRLCAMDVFDDRRDLNGVAVLRVNLAAELDRQRPTHARGDGLLIHVGIWNSGENRIRYLAVDEASQKAGCVASGSSGGIVTGVGRKHGRLTGRGCDR